MTVFRQMTGVYSFCSVSAQHVSCANVYTKDRCLQLLQCVSPTRILCQCLYKGQVSTASAMHQPNTYPVPMSTHRTGVYSFYNVSAQHVSCANVYTEDRCLRLLYWILSAAGKKEFRPLVFKGWKCGSSILKTKLLSVESCVRCSNYTLFMEHVFPLP